MEDVLAEEGEAKKEEAKKEDGKKEEGKDDAKKKDEAKKEKEKDEALEKATKDSKEEEYSYYTASEEESSSSQKPAIPKQPARAAPSPPAKVLEKVPEQHELEKRKNATKALEKARDKLQKSFKDVVLEKPKPNRQACILKPGPGSLNKRHPVGPWKRPRVIVDWHNTLELNDQVPPSHDKALDALLEKADVYMLSYCGPNRMVQAMKDMHNVRQAHRFSAVQTCSMKSE